MSKTDGDALDNGALLTSLNDEIAGLVHERVDRLNQLEQRITLADRILRMSQPPMPGKIGVQWWKMHSGDRYRTPVLVRWRPLRNGRWRAQPMKQVHKKMLLKNGTAALCMDDTWDVVQEVKVMIRAYVAGVKDVLALTRRLNTAHQSIEPILLDASTSLYASYMSVEGKLIRSGYTMDGRTGKRVNALLNPALD